MFFSHFLSFNAKRFIASDLENGVLKLKFKIINQSFDTQNSLARKESILTEDYSVFKNFGPTTSIWPFLRFLD